MKIVLKIHQLCPLLYFPIKYALLCNPKPLDFCTWQIKDLYKLQSGENDIVLPQDSV
jgi:hypothetical protein